MKKKKINALLTAGCLTFLAPSAANAADDWTTTPNLTDVTSDTTATVTDSTGATFSTINVKNGATLTIDSTNGAVTPNAGEGAVTMTGTSAIQLAPAINTITFSSTTASGANTITQNDASTSTTSIGATTVSDNSSLNINLQGGSISATSASVGNGSTLTLNNTATPASSAITLNNAITVSGGNLVTNGTNTITANGVNASGTSAITNTNATTSLGGITLDNATANVTGVKAANHTGFTFVGNNTVNSNNSDLEDISVATGQTVSVNSTGATTYTSADVQGTLDLNATTDADTINGTATSLNNGTLNVQGEGAVTLDGVNVEGTSTIANTNTNATTSLGGITLDNAIANVTGIKAANHTGFTFVGNNTVNSNNSDLEDISVATGQTVSVNSTGATTYTSANVQGTLDLNATTDADTINGTATSLNNGTLNVQGAGAVTLDGVNVEGTSTIENTNTNATTSLGGITLTNATANVTGVKAENHTGFTFVGDNTLNSNNSDLEDISVATGQTVTVNSTGATTYTSADVQGTLDLNATTDADTINGTATSLNNGTLNVQGAGAVTLDGISATGTSSITNANTNDATDLGNITMNGDVSLTLNNLASNNNILLNGVENKRLTLDNSNFNSVAISAGQTLDINSVNNSSVVASASLTGADANSANLNLKADSADLTLNALQVNGYSNVDITDADGFGTSIGDIGVQATNNAITNSSNAQVYVGDIAFADGINNALNLSGAQGFDVNSITSGGTDVINIENASVDSIVVNAADNLQINGNMSYGSANVNGTLGLNATDAADAIISSGTTALNDASLNLAGSGAVQLNAVTATGTNTISNNAASATITNATVSADSSLDINASTDIDLDNVVLNQSAVATDSLNLNANGGDIVLNSLNMNGNNNATANGANNIQITDLVANGLNNNFDNSNSGVVSMNTVELNAGSSLVLDGSSINATNLDMHGGELTLDAGVSFTDTAIDGANNHIINNVVTNTLGDVTLDNTSVILENVRRTNYDNLSVVGDNTVTLRNSLLKNVDLVAGQDLTIKTDANSGNESFGTVNMADSASLTLDAVAGTALGANNINPSTVAMKGNNILTTRGSGDISINGISVEGQANTIDNTNVKTTLGSISMNDAELKVSNLHQGTNFTDLSLTGNNKIYSKDSSFGELNVPANSTLTLGTQAGSTTATTYTNANLIGENATDTNTLKLDASNAAIVGNNLKLETYSLGYGPANNSKNNVEISGTNEVQLGDVSVTGIQNTISSTNTETTKIGDITFVNEPAVGNELTLNGNFETTGNLTTASAADVLETNGEIKLFGLAVGSTHNLTVESTGGNTTFTTTAGIPTLADGATLTLNANGGSITADTTDSVISTSATGNSTLNIQGADAVILNGVNLSGNNTLRVSNTNENTTLGNVNLGNGLDATTLNMSNGVIETVRVNDLNIADNSNWVLDVNATTHTADTIDVAGQIAGSKLNFAINNVAGQTTDKFVSYMKLIDSADYVLNTTGIADNRHVMQVTGTNVYYSYVDKDAVDYDPEDGDYLANTVRVTNYNIDSDQLLDYVTRQGERTFRIGGGVQNVALTGITALPNLEARDGVNNILTLQDENGDEIIDGADAAQMFKIDTTGDSIERTLNLQGLTFANAVTDAANGTPNGAVILTNSTDAAATVNLSSFESTNGTVNPLFKDNTATQDGGVIYNSGAASSVNSTSDANIIFKNNIAGRNGGAIANVNNATINFKGDTTFEENIAQGDGGAIYNDNATLKIGAADKTTKFVDNVATGSGGALASVDNDTDFIGTTEFNGQSAGVNGGAISADGSDINMNGTQTFTNNSAAGLGGAIYAKNATINIAATRAGENSTFSGNTDSNGSNAIYFDGGSTINLSANEGSAIIFEDSIAGTADNNNLVQKQGSVYYNNDNSAYSGDFSLLAGDAYFTNANSVAFNGGTYKLDGGSTLHLTNGKLDTINANTIDLSNTSLDNAANLAIDLNLKKNQEDSDKFILTTPSAGGNINVSEINLLNGENDKKFIPYDIAEGAEFTSSMKEVETPYYYYNVKGRTSGLDLTRGRLADTGLMAPQVAVNARLAGQLDLYNQMLHRVDEIAEYRYFNKVNKNNLYASAYETIDNKYTPYVNQEDGGNAWMKPSVTLETIRPDSDGGVEKYKNRAYNTILGYETPISTLRNGWELINTVFGGYQGSFQQYDNIKNYQNGGVGGYMANLYKNNFFAGGVVSAGAIGVDTKDSGRYGRGMSFGLFDIGAAARVGYNVGMGKNWLFQPMFTTSYIYISGISKHNNRGEEMELDGTNTLLLSPGFKLVGNYNGWQPYALFDYTWPLIAKTVANVNNLELPDMQLRSYVEYGVGLRKNFGDKFTGYGEAVFRNIGRTGVTLQGGFVYKF